MDSSYVALRQRRSDLQQSINARAVIRNKITHSRILRAWDAYEGPIDADEREQLAALEAELAKREAA